MWSGEDIDVLMLGGEVGGGFLVGETATDRQMGQVGVVYKERNNGESSGRIAEVLSSSSEGNRVQYTSGGGWSRKEQKHFIIRSNRQKVQYTGINLVVEKCESAPLPLFSQVRGEALRLKIGNGEEVLKV